MRVEPIRDKDVIRRLTEALADDRSEAGERRFLMWMTGLYLGRRISDMLRLKVRDVYGQKKLSIMEGKTGKQIDLYIPRTLMKVYDERLKDRDPDEPLLVSRQADRITGKKKAVNRETCYRDMKLIKKLGRMPDSMQIGTHTLRKTFGYHYYQSTKDMAGLMKLFNHSNEEITQIYIGLRSDELRETFRNVDSMY